jgi:hypothetical protein
VWSVSSRFLNTIRYSHQVYARIDVLYQGAVIYSTLPFTTCSVTLDRTASIRGRCEVTLGNEALLPANIADVLTPLGNELAIYRVYVIPAGTNYGTAIRDLILAAASWLPYSVTATASTTPLLVYDDFGDGGRWKAAQEMATAIGYQIYFSGNGTLIIKPESDPGSTPAWTVDDGPGGVVVSSAQSWSRVDTYNSVVATASGSNNPARAISHDLDPTSPTYYHGVFGHKVLRYSSALITTQTQAQAAADALLRRSLGVTQGLNVSAIPNPALEPGDVVRVRRLDRGIDQTCVIDKLDFGLRASDPMTIGVRNTQVLVS